MKRLLTILVALGSLTLTGCPGPWDRAGGQAVKVCGEGNVAYVDKDDGQFGCHRDPQTSEDTD